MYVRLLIMAHIINNIPMFHTFCDFNDGKKYGYIKQCLMNVSLRYHNVYIIDRTKII